jgi:GH15 family glucan-1,4-alpha-glucosidase
MPYTSSQQYLDGTNILETTIATDGGACTVTECMPIFQDRDGSRVERHHIVRIVRGQSGRVTVNVSFQPRPDYGRIVPTLTRQGRDIVWHSSRQQLTLSSDADLVLQNGSASGSITVERGQEVAFILTYSGATHPPPAEELDAAELVQRTMEFWRNEARQVEYDGRWRDQVVRSFLCLHLLTYLPTGAIVAAPTTSLPERIGGMRI